MDKTKIKAAMLALEEGALAYAREEYEAYVAGARLDRSEPVDDDQQAQANVARYMSDAFDDDIHDHLTKLASIDAIDFGPKERVAPGALVEIADRLFVIAVATGRFHCDGRDLMGISPAAPIYSVVKGLRSGDSFVFNDREYSVGLVA